METEEDKSKEYLTELYRLTGGDTAVQVSMHEVGAAIGLDKGAAGSLAEELMVLGQAELRTLAGGISITADGLAVLGIAVAAPQSAENRIQLSHGPVAGESDRQTMQQLSEEIKKSISGLKLEYDLLEEIVLDLKTIEVHLLSPKPKTAILRELLRSLHAAFEKADAGQTAARLKAML